MNEKENGKVALREITHPRGRNYMEKIPQFLRKMEYPTSFPVQWKLGFNWIAVHRVAGEYV